MFHEFIGDGGGGLGYIVRLILCCISYISLAPSTRLLHQYLIIHSLHQIFLPPPLSHTFLVSLSLDCFYSFSWLFLNASYLFPFSNPLVNFCIIFDFSINKLCDIACLLIFYFFKKQNYNRHRLFTLEVAHIVGVIFFFQIGKG
jgi:hypothetical protein